MDPYLPQSRLPQLRTDERVGDLERTQACDQLSGAFAAGRLDQVELEDRIARAVSARTRMDLLLLVHDLGTPTPAARPAPAPVPRSGWSGPDLLALVLLIGCSVLVSLMLLVLGAVSPPYFFASLIGGTLAFVAGVSATQLVQRSVRRTRESLQHDR